MKTLLCICAAMGMALAVVTAHAADVTGTWTAEVTTPNGDNVQLTFNFKQDGEKLTGTVEGPQGDAIEIANGKVDGDKLSFDVSINDITISHEGTINGDEIKLSTKSNQPDIPEREMTLKRARQP